MAEVEAPNREAVFALSNHGALRADWTQNPGVILRTSDDVRSTSVGDVIVAPDGTAWICAPVGWWRVAPDGSISI